MANSRLIYTDIFEFTISDSSFLFLFLLLSKLNMENEEQVM